MVLGRLEERACLTEHLPIHGAEPSTNVTGPLGVYGADAAGIMELAAKEPSGLKQALHPALPLIRAQVIWAVRHEMARTVDDVLARRTRALFLNARAALEMAPEVARLMASELGRGQAWEQQQLKDFNEIAGGFLIDIVSQSL
jgi:glycerol-3-phosphate dehydrogenase